jgi:hypothetical protein
MNAPAALQRAPNCVHPGLAGPLRPPVLGLDRRGDLDRHQVAAGVVDPHRQARRDRHGGGAHLDAADLAGRPRHLGRGAVFGVRPRLPAGDRVWRVAADPLPKDIDEAAGDHWVASNRRLWSTGTLEKVVLMGFLWVIYAQVLPESGASTLELFLGVANFVVINAALSLMIARRTRSLASAPAAFGAQALLNIALVLVGTG